MSDPQTVKEYLANFNDCLEVGFRSRRLIFLEVSDHLSQGVESERRTGVSPSVAERRAITAFGPPEEVARSFEAGLVGVLDKRLAVKTRRLHAWMASHRWGAAVIKMALFAVILAVVMAVGTLAGAKHPPPVLALLMAGVLWVLWLSPQATLRGRLGAQIRAVARRPRKHPPKRAAHDPRQELWYYTGAWSWGLVIAWLTMAEDASPFRLPLWQVCLWLGLFLGSQLVADWATDRGVALAARRRAPATEGASRRSWEVEHPWRTALFDVWSLPLGLLALVLIYPSPLELRGAFTALMAAMTALLVICLRLLRNQRDKGSYARSLQN